MKQTLLLFLLSFLVFGLSAQLSFDPEVVSEEFDVKTVFDLENHLDLTNANSDDAQFVWNVETVEAPSEWSFYICDLNKCYGPGTTFVSESGANTIDGDSTKAVFFHLLPASTEGYGKYIFNLTTVGNTSDVLASIELEFEAKSTVSSTEIDIESISVFPNPVNDYFNLNNPNDVASQIVIYDVLGKQIKAFNTSNSSNYYVGDLQSGRYFARIFDNAGKSLKVVRIVKR